MRDQIKEVATEMLIRHGYLGLRFQQIAEALEITRGNVHYHFGTKEALTDECVVDYTTTTIGIFRNIWLNQDIRLEDKINQTMLSNYRRYLKFNPTETTVHPWSLIARMRSERNLLSKKSLGALNEFSAQLENLITEGVRCSVKNGELREDSPVNQIALQIVLLCNSADPIIQDAGTFDRLAQLYRGFLNIIEHAYGIRQKPVRAKVSS
jgi:TetR/AcrR family transcriptional repressor of nem operon